MTMTALEAIKKFMATLDVQNYADATSALDDAVRSISRFNGIQDAIDNFLEDRKACERQAIKDILGSYYKTEYDGLQLVDLLKKAETDTSLASALAVERRYSNGRPNAITAEERIRLRTADLFLAECGIELPRYVYRAFNTDTQTMMATYSDYYSTGNNDTGAITGKDAGSSTTEKDSDTVVPEIGNKYTAKTSAPQNISTGTNDWIVTATDYGDTITSGGADSIDAGGGGDVVYVEGENATIKTGADDKAADKVVVRSNVQNVTISELEEWDTLNIEGDFSISSATLSNDTVTIVDSSGRTVIIENWTTAKNATITFGESTGTISTNSQKIGAWLSDFIDYEDTSTGDSITEEATLAAYTVNLEKVTDVGGSFSASSTASEATYSANSTSGNVGAISTEFPDVSTFTTRGLTVELLGRTTGGANATVRSLVLSQLSTDEKVVFAGLYKWWVKEGLKLNEESFGLGFETEDVISQNIKVFFYNDSKNDELAAVINNNGRDLRLRINMAHFSGISETDENGSGNTTLLDRTLAHELNHAILAANISNFNILPQFFTEGVAELVHGIDDERVTRIWDLAAGTTFDSDTDTARIDTVFDLTDNGTGDNDVYAGGYMFLRYLAKQAAAETLPALGDATVAVNLTGENATYYANLTSSSSIEIADTEKSTSNVSIGTANDLTYTPAAGIKQSITSSNANWTFKNIGNYTTIKAGSGNDSVTIVSSQGNFDFGNGKNVVSISGGKNNTISTGTGDDNFFLVNAKNNEIYLGAGTNNVSIANAEDGYFVGDSSGNTIIGGAGADSVYLNQVTGNTISLGGGTNTAYISNNASGNTITSGNGNDTVTIGGSENIIQTGSGDDSIRFANFGITSLDNQVTENRVDAGAGNDTVHLYGVGNYADAGAGNDNIYIYTSNHSIVGGTGADTIHISNANVSELHISDFSISQNDILHIGFHVSSSSISKNSFTINNTTVYLDNAESISDFLDMTVYHNGTTESVRTTLKDLLGVDSFNWTEGTYNFLVEDNAADIYDGAIYYTQAKTGTPYVTVKVNANTSIVVSANSDVTITLTTPDSNFYSGTFGNNSYSFTGTAQFLSNLAQKGTFNVKGNFYTYDGKTIKYSGSGSVKVGLDDALTVSNFAAGEQVTINDAETTEIYTADREYITKKVVTANTDSEGNLITTYQAAYKADDITNAEFSEVNQYIETDGAINLLSGSFTNSGNTFEIVSADNGITLLYNAAGTKFVGIDNFDAGESIKINGQTFTNINNQIINAEGKGYNGEWSEFISNFENDDYWGKVDGWSIDEDGNAIYTFNKETLITVSGLSSNAQATDFSLNGTTVTVSANALDSSNDVTISAGYTLALGADVQQPTNSNAVWKVSNNGTAIYSVTKSAGYITDGSIITYQAEIKDVPQITISNLKNNASANDISLSGTTVTISEDALDPLKTVTISAGYTLALGADVTTPESFDAAWKVTNSTAIYSATTTEGYVTNGYTITYQPQIEGVPLVTVYNLSNTANADNFSLNDKIVTVSEGALDPEKTVTISSGYTLALAESVAQPQAKEAEWEVTNGVAVYSAKTTAGYTTNGLTISYKDEVEGDAIVTVSNLQNNASTDEISLSGTTVTISAGALDSSKTVEISKGYTLALGKDVKTPESQGTYWQVANGTAIYSETFSEGYVTDGSTISYQGESQGEAQITISNLSNNATAAHISQKGARITISAGALDPTKVVTVSSGYRLLLGDDVVTSKATGGSWEFSNGTGTFTTAGTSAGYAISDNTIVYLQATGDSSQITVTGLKSTATAKNITIEGKTVTIAASIVQGNVTVTEGYALDFEKGTYTNSTVTGGAGVDSITANGTGLVINSGAGSDLITLGKGTSKNTINAGTGDDYISTTRGKNVYQYASGDGNDIIEGFSDNDTLNITSGTISGWDIDDKDLILYVGNGSITLKDRAGKNIYTAIGTAKATSNIFGGGVIYNDKQTAATISSNYSGSYTAESTVISIDATAAGAIEIIGNAKSNKIEGGNNSDTIDGGKGNDTIYGGAGDDSLLGDAGNDKIYGDEGDDTLYGGAGNDTLTGGAGKDVFIYSGGNDVITDYAEEDKISVTGEISSVSATTNDIALKVGSDKLTIKNAIGKKVTVNDEVRIYEKGKIYDGDKTSITLTSAATLGNTFTNVDASALSGTFKYSANANSNSLIGGKGGDSILGGGGDDTIIGNAGNDKLYGDAGNDVIEGGAGTDSIFGGEGNDYLDGGDGNDTLNGGTGSNTLTGGKGNDLFIYSGGDDTITDYETGKDKIKIAEEIINSYADGSDVVFKTASGSLTVQNGAGKKITILDAKNKSSVYIHESGWNYNEARTAVTIDADFSGSYTAENTVVSIYGSAADAVEITGNTKANKIYGGKGSSTLDGGKGNDTLYGGESDDLIYGGDGNDTLTGNTGSNTLTGGKGNDLFIYDGGEDIVTDYEEGKDKIKISEEITNSYAEGSDVIFKTASGSLTVQNGVGKKITILDAKNKSSVQIFASGWSYNDKKTAVTIDADYSGSYTAENTIVSIDGAAADAVEITGNSKANKIYGGTGENTIYGGAGNDTIYGGESSDSIFGDAGNDKLYGNAGGDTLNGGLGNDTFNGGDGADTFVYSGGNDVIEDYNEEDKIVIANGTITSVSVSNKDVALKIGSNTLKIKDGVGKNITVNDEVYIYEKGKIYNGDKTWVVFTAAVTETLDSSIVTVDGSSSSGSLKLTANGNANSILGGKSNDSISGGVGRDTIYGNAGSDKIWGDLDNDYLDGGAGNDTVYGGSGADSIYGDAGNDKLYGDDGNDYIEGGAGNDLLYGGRNDDTLAGGAGNDSLYGGAGVNSLSGGAGADVFVNEGGDDYIDDYVSGEDKIKFTSEIASYAISGVNVIIKTEDGGNVTIRRGVGKEITIVDKNNKTTKETYNTSYSRTLDLIEDNNFVSDDFSLDEITEQKFEVQNIETQNYDLAQNNSILAYSEDK